MEGGDYVRELIIKYRLSLSVMRKQNRLLKETIPYQNLNT